METKNLLDTDGDTASDTNKLADEAREAERKALEDKARSEELARVRAEAELAGMQRAQDSMRAQQQPVQISEEQWQRAELESGLTRQQIQANAALTKQMIDANLTPLQKALEDAKKEAQEAKDRLSRFEAKGNSSTVEQKFYESNPAYAAHKGDVEEFLGMFPENDRNDPKKLKDILEKAKTYVKGKVGGKMKEKSGGSARLGGDDTSSDSSTTEIDYTGLDDAGNRRVIEDVANDVNSRMSDKEFEAMFKKSSSSDGRGVRFDSEAEFKKGDEMLRRGSKFGGNR